MKRWIIEGKSSGPYYRRFSMMVEAKTKEEANDFFMEVVPYCEEVSEARCITMENVKDDKEKTN